jgi:GTPase Era involved in 16S rRNA processing
MFEIKVALLGYVSAGKSTVLNALLQDSFSEVAMRRTTVGVNYFRVHVKDNASDALRVEDESAKEATVPANEMAADISDGKNTHTLADDDAGSLPNKKQKVFHAASETLREITIQNARLRQTLEIQETTYDVQVDEPLCDMRNDTKLVLIDVPGLNEAGSKDLYRDYVNAKWDTFDCVIAVMDVHQGVNTEEPIQLLELIQANLQQKRRIPVIVLCNKVNNLHDDEVMMLVEEVRTKGCEIIQSHSLTETTVSSDEPNEDSSTLLNTHPGELHRSDARNGAEPSSYPFPLLQRLSRSPPRMRLFIARRRGSTLTSSKSSTRQSLRNSATTRLAARNGASSRQKSNMMLLTLQCTASPTTSAV